MFERSFAAADIFAAMSVASIYGTVILYSNSMYPFGADEGSTSDSFGGGAIGRGAMSSGWTSDSFGGGAISVGIGSVALVTFEGIEAFASTSFNWTRRPASSEAAPDGGG
jgi:hypothetical protein